MPRFPLEEPFHQSEKMKREEMNKYLYEWGSNQQPVDLQAHFVPLHHDWPLVEDHYKKLKIAALDSRIINITQSEF